MSLSDFMKLNEKATIILGHDVKINDMGHFNPNVVSNDFCDMFTLSGKLNKETKKDFKNAIKSGALPKRATIRDFFFAVMSLI